jgi:hypothetical protein
MIQQGASHFMELQSMKRYCKWSLTNKQLAGNGLMYNNNRIVHLVVYMLLRMLLILLMILTL